MGLDMYAHTRKDALSQAVDFDWIESDTELFYWRKHPNLHGWMERLYRERGGTDEDFNLSTVQLTAEDLDRLEAAVMGENLPETAGFYFGSSSPEDREDDLKFIAKGREALAQGDSLYYRAWW